MKCDGTTKYSYVEVTVKGARHNNEDASYADGKLFGVYDGHGGKHASILLRTKVGFSSGSNITTYTLMTDPVANMLQGRSLLTLY